MVRSRDNQRSKVYSWERSDLKALGHNLFKSVLTEDECELIIVNAVRWWGRENLLSKLPAKKDFINRYPTESGGRVRVEFRNYSYGGKSWYRRSTNTVTLTKQWALNKGVCLHETAHLLLNKNPERAVRNCASHGAEFMRIYLTLLVRFTPFTMSQLSQSARKRRVKISGLTVEGYDIRPYSEFQKTA